jgi:hypothetical protein
MSAVVYRPVTGPTWVRVPGAHQRRQQRAGDRDADPGHDAPL